MSLLRVRSWQSLSQQVGQLYQPPDYVIGPTNSHASVRKPEKSPNAGTQGGDGPKGSIPWKITLFRDNHAWCPYCQKVWLFLEEKRVTYEIRKVTMFCYGEKEAWYKQIVPRGMLPAMMIEDPNDSKKKQVITESDVLLEVLEDIFGPLGTAQKGKSLYDEEVVKNRQLERKLFSYWCQWLCRPSSSTQSEEKCKKQFQDVCREVEARIKQSPSPYFLDDFGISDTIFTPYIERMQSSLYYYKGFDMRGEHPVIDQWFSAMESRECYRGTKSDHHTHVHDLPPQMGGCYYAYGYNPQTNNVESIGKCITHVDAPGLNSSNDKFALHEVNESSFPEPAMSRIEACYRFLKHRENVAKINPVQDEGFDVAVRAVLTRLLEEHTGSTAGESDAQTIPSLPKNSALALFFIRDRLSIPRDMSFWAGRRFRETLGKIAEEYGQKSDLNEYHKNNFPGNEHQNKWAIPIEHRRDTDPSRFRM